MQALPASTPRQPLRILELGAGTGAMAERILAADMLTDATYTAIDANPDNIAQARRHLPQWATERGFDATANDGGLHLQRGRQHVGLHVEAIDLFDFIERERCRQTWDLLIAHALIDLLDVPTALPLLFSVLRPGGLFYFPITFDGASILEPAIDPGYDDCIERFYHDTMDQRLVRGKPSGDSRTGRHLFTHLRALGVDVLDAGSSDWVVFAGAQGYPADEAYFLHFIIHTFYTALTSHPQLDPERFTRWIRQRHAQVEDGSLVFIAHQLDLLGSLPKQPDT